MPDRDNASSHSTLRRVISKLYFVIFVAFKQSVILNLDQRSFKDKDSSGNQKPVYDKTVDT